MWQKYIIYTGQMYTFIRYIFEVGLTVMAIIRLYQSPCKRVLFKKINIRKYLHIFLTKWQFMAKGIIYIWWIIYWQSSLFRYYSIHVWERCVSRATFFRSLIKMIIKYDDNKLKGFCVLVYKIYRHTWC